MKRHAFEVIYLNGNEELFYCQTYEEAIILAMSYAIDRGWDMRIKYIVNEHGVQIQDIKFPAYNFSK